MKVHSSIKTVTGYIINCERFLSGFVARIEAQDINNSHSQTIKIHNLIGVEQMGVYASK